jgi:hypothetical protein
MECVTAMPISAKSGVRGGTPEDKRTLEGAITVELVTIWTARTPFPLSRPVAMIKVRPSQYFVWRIARRKASPELREGG